MGAGRKTASASPHHHGRCSEQHPALLSPIRSPSQRAGSSSDLRCPIGLFFHADHGETSQLRSVEATVRSSETTKTQEVRYMARNNRKKPARTLLEKRRAKQEKRAVQAVRERKRDRLQRAVGV